KPANSDTLIQSPNTQPTVIDVTSIPTTSYIQPDNTIINPSNITPPQGAISASYNPNSAAENNRVQSTLSRGGWQSAPNISAIAQPQSQLVRPQTMNGVPPNVSAVATNTINPPTVSSDGINISPNGAPDVSGIIRPRTVSNAANAPTIPQIAPAPVTRGRFAPQVSDIQVNAAGDSPRLRT